MLRVLELPFCELMCLISGPPKRFLKARTASRASGGISRRTGMNVGGRRLVLDSFWAVDEGALVSRVANEDRTDALWDTLSTMDCELGHLGNPSSVSESAVFRRPPMEIPSSVLVLGDDALAHSLTNDALVLLRSLLAVEMDDMNDAYPESFVLLDRKLSWRAGDLGDFFL